MDGHICELVTKTDYVTDSSERLSYVYFKRLWTNLRGISERTPKCNRYMTSMASIAAERRKHDSFKHWWIIHPFSIFRFFWEIFMTFIYLISFITIPFMISYVIMDYEDTHLDRINLPIYAFYWLDILCNSITGYYDKKILSTELEPQKIVTKYFQGFLVIDILSSFPYDHITYPWRRLPGNDSYNVVTLLNILPLVKLVRYYTLHSNIHQLFAYFEIQNFYSRMYSTLLLGIYVIFWFACLCYLIPVLVIHFLNIPPSECPDCWMTGLEEKGLAFRFQNALYIVLENLLACGYGLFTPKTDPHISLSAILMILGRLFECYFIVMFLQTKGGKKASESKFQEIMNQLTAYTRQKQLPLHMKRRLLAYYQYRFKNRFFREKVILSSLSEQLRQEIALQSCRRLVENVEIFKNLPKHILQSIVRNLKFELYLSNDVIVKAGSQGDCMFFLSTGTVTVLTPTGKEICHLEDGAHFGEVALLVPDQRRVASVVAIEVCEVYRLDRKDFRKCIAVHTELFAKIERIATERVERAVMVEEQHKRYLMRGSYGGQDDYHRKELRDRHFA